MSAEFETSDASEQQLLSRGAVVAGDAERFYYGYPLLLFLDRDDWCVSPLFMREVEVRPLDHSRYVAQITEAEGLEVNLHLFQKQRVPPEPASCDI